MLEWIKYEISYLHQGSIVSRWFGWIRIGGKYPINDGVAPLRDSPLGMFFYNQRAIFYGGGLFFLLLLVLLAKSTPFPESETWKTLALLAACWSGGVFATLFLHRRFVKSVQEWALRKNREEFPRTFDVYFLIDFFITFILIAIGKIIEVDVDQFAFLLFANMVVYSACSGGKHDFNVWVIIGALVVALIVTFLLFSKLALREPYWFHFSLHLGPPVGTLLVAILSVSVVSWLRTMEKEINDRHFDLLGGYETDLSKAVLAESERDFRRNITRILRHLCSLARVYRANSINSCLPRTFRSFCV